MKGVCMQKKKKSSTERWRDNLRTPHTRMRGQKNNKLRIVHTDVRIFLFFIHFCNRPCGTRHTWLFAVSHTACGICPKPAGRNHHTRVLYVVQPGVVLCGGGGVAPTAIRPCKKKSGESRSPYPQGKACMSKEARGDIHRKAPDRAVATTKSLSDQIKTCPAPFVERASEREHGGGWLTLD